jgi:hypothetical protein
MMTPLPKGMIPLHCKRYISDIAVTVRELDRSRCKARRKLIAPILDGFSWSDLANTEVG